MAASNASMHRNKSLIAFAVLATATLLTLSACAPQRSEEIPATNPDSSSTVDVPEIVALPVGDPFGNAAWSVEAGEATLTVTPDRLVALDRNTVRTWAADGKEAWTYEAPESTSNISVLQETVAVIAHGQSDGEGLDKVQQILQVTLLSLDDGAIVSEVEVADSEISSHGLAFNLKSAEWGSVGSDGFVVIGEDGSSREIDASYAESVKTVDGIPFWSNASELQTESWNARDLGLGMSDVKLIDDSNGLLLLSNTSGKGDTEALSMVKAETGAILYTVSCPTDRYGWGASGGNDGSVARNSPNGQYGVAARLLFSAATSQCVGGGEQQNVGLTAVDNNGTAYGSSEEGDLVVVSFGGEPKVSPLPAGASAPIGVMNGNIAIHWDQNTGIATGNPIKAN